MNAETLTALKASIAKWERNAEAKTPDNFKVSPEACPLCSLFNAIDTPDEDVCAGCPISTKTGKTYCEGTPYMPAWKAWFSWTKQPRQPDFRHNAHAAARDEVAFLKSLLPEEHQS